MDQERKSIDEFSDDVERRAEDDSWGDGGNTQPERVVKNIEDATTDIGDVNKCESPSVVARFGKSDECSHIGSYKRIQSVEWKNWHPRASVIVDVDGKPVSAARIFHINLIGPGRSMRSRGVSVRERSSTYPVVAIGAIGTEKGYEGKGYMGAALDFIVNEYSGKASAIVAITRDPDRGLWIDHGFVKTATTLYVDSTLVAHVLDKDAFSLNAIYEVPFHF